MGGGPCRAGVPEGPKQASLGVIHRVIHQLGTTHMDVISTNVVSEFSFLSPHRGGDGADRGVLRKMSAQPGKGNWRAWF